MEEHDGAGRAPSPTLREVGDNKLGLSALNRDLMDAVDTADATAQRAIAHWAARSALVAAKLHMFPEFARAILALQGGEELPPPFDDQKRAEVRDTFPDLNWPP
ncbi:hypothetical protein OG897_33625 [Streptomyces sp. NBC_00237]|uniref:hypothetical protein n=1 Tax=Streptomyces sp. NBC_00237 TaxID=2975687 RepID=UPI00225A047D|nr:hypothetical protein [Streptomyces sp. NBC_00237]MCX5206334.1 hypothetical protein [Streptomyces sp. NBC_00237]